MAARINPPVPTDEAPASGPLEQAAIVLLCMG